MDVAHEIVPFPSSARLYDLPTRRAFFVVTPHSGPNAQWSDIMLAPPHSPNVASPTVDEQIAWPQGR